MTGLDSRRRLQVLATVCLAAFAINLDTTIVNVAVPDLGRELGATTRDLQWIVDGYNLAFAALVLTAGSLGDRFGRRPALLIGLAGFALFSGVGAMVTSAGALVAIRFLMGASAAVIFPTTLSIITNTFPERRERAKAIGVWGAVTGLGVAVGPMTGGFLLAHFGWPSVFVALVPVALVALVATWAWVPESSNPADPTVRTGLSHFPPPGGIRFNLYTVPPSTTSRPPFTEAMREELDLKLPGRASHMESDQAGRHRTTSVDLIVVLSGRISLDLDNGVSVDLVAGDTVIQNGTRHAWRNDSDSACTCAIVLIGR